MKLSKVEKIILAVFLVIVIFAVGVFTFILPEVGKIADNTLNYVNAVAERDAVNATLARESSIDAEIEAAIASANSGSEKFYEEITSYEADVIVRDILTATKMETQGLAIEAFTTADLTLSSFLDVSVNYPLRDYANFNSASAAVSTDTAAADTAAAATDTAATDTAAIAAAPVWTDESGNAVEPTKDQLREYLSTQTQTVGSTTVTFEIEGTRGNFIKFLDYVKDLPQATYIQMTSIAYTEQTEAVADADGNVITAASDNELTDGSEITASITIIFYSVEKINQELIDQAEAALS